MIKDKVELSNDTLVKLHDLKKKGYRLPSLGLIKSTREIELIKKSAKINTGLLDELEKHVKVGITTIELDNIANEYYQRNGAIAAPLNYNGYPNSICVSINEVVCHGIPSKRKLKSGDIVNIDVSTIYNGYFSDASRMYLVGEINDKDKDLVAVTKEALALALNAVKPYSSINVIGDTIEKYANSKGYSVVRELGGHGIGLAFHEEPFIYHYHRTMKDMIMVPGMIFTVEPMINQGKREVYLDSDDEWTIYTQDGLKSAQVEHMVLITDNGVEILSY